MAENPNPLPPSSEQIEENGEMSINLQEGLDALYEEDQQAIAVLGGSDEKSCTYSKGYVKRQALYSCLTCCPESTDPEKRAGVCLACSLKCHENHDLVELYTKRNFRCDCGGARMKAIRCTLEPIKFGVNERNSYNQNFSGVYCTCKRPYPDPEDPIEDEMIQCVLCEDWYHGRHLDAKVPDSENYAEMVCGECMMRCEVLKHYVGLCVEPIVKAAEEEEKVDVERAAGSDPEPTPKRIKLDDDACMKPPVAVYSKGAVFWPDDWRAQLCRCDACMKAYVDLQIEFLLDSDDTVQNYERRGKKRVEEEVEAETNRAFEKLGRVGQIEFLTGYNLFKTRLTDFLGEFAANGRTVTSADINEFFSKLREEKAADPVSMKNFCH